MRLYSKSAGKSFQSESDSGEVTSIIKNTELLDTKKRTYDVIARKYQYLFQTTPREEFHNTCAWKSDNYSK